MKSTALATPAEKTAKPQGSFLKDPDAPAGKKTTNHHNNALQPGKGFDFGKINIHNKHAAPFYPNLQAKLKINPPGDAYEKEAGAIAEKATLIPTQAMKAGPAHNDFIAGRAYSQYEQKNREKTYNKPVLQKSIEDSGLSASPGLAAQLADTKGSGFPLDNSTKNFMENTFQNSFSNVRIHTGSEAAGMNQELNAIAFTNGADIYFNRGDYDPASNEGKELLAHELTHVIQQTKGLGQASGLPQKTAQNNDNPVLSQPKATHHGSKQISPWVQLQDRPGPSTRQRSRTTPQPAVPVAQSAATEQLRLRQDLHLLLNIYEHQILARLADWSIAARNVGSAYATAAERHQQAIADRARSQALMEAALFGVLTAVCAGGLGWLAGTAAATSLQTIMRLSEEAFENAQDTLVVVVSEGIDVVQAAVQPQAQSVSQNPLVFQNDVSNIITREEIRVRAQFEQWLTALLDAPLSAFRNRDRLATLRSEIEAWTRSSAQLKGGAGLPNIENMARELERGFWAQWIMRNLVTHVRERYHVDEFGVRDPVPTPAHDEYSSPGAAIEARLNHLGITRDSGVGDFGWYTSDSEMEQLVTWARSYHVKPFITAPAAP